MNIVTKLQSIGRALMLPIAVLPVAALLMRFGHPDLLDVPAMAAAGNAIFANLGLLFAIGVAVGLARENHGAAGLAGVVAYLVATKGAEVLIAVPPEATANLTAQLRDMATAAYRSRELAKLSVPAGLLCGIVAGVLYNRYSDVRLPSYLAFFGGRRFVPIVSGLAGIVLALCFGFGWPILERGMDAASKAILASDSFGLFAYGVLNRALIVTGLHHILNNIAWYLLGDYHGATGDMNRFFSGDPSAGLFMAGFFPMMMFGLPAACLAMYRSAAPARRKAVGGLLLSMGLTSFLTGVTEPVEFSFVFLAPVLFAIHAVLTGISFVVMDWLGVRLGFGFSAGVFDYVLNYSIATRPLLLFAVGAAYFALYYAVFRFFIVRFDLKTPGRESEASAPAIESTGNASAQGWIIALGGAKNLVAVDACMTRLRLVVANQNVVDEAALKALGARAIVRPSAETLQVVIGPIADQVAGDIRAQLKAAPSIAPKTTSARDILDALGGAANVRDVQLSSTRLCVTVADGERVDAGRISALGARAVARPTPASVHIVVGPGAAALFEGLQAAR
jgi:PTS system N-acetylglucosamine-specific IIC component